MRRTTLNMCRDARGLRLSRLVCDTPVFSARPETARICCTTMGCRRVFGVENPVLRSGHSLSRAVAWMLRLCCSRLIYIGSSKCIMFVCFLYCSRDDRFASVSFRFGRSHLYCLVVLFALGCLMQRWRLSREQDGRIKLIILESCCLNVAEPCWYVRGVRLIVPKSEIVTERRA